MKFSVRIKQHDASDCGVASLASVAAFYGRRLSVQTLRISSGTTSEGTTIRGLAEAAAINGLRAEGYKGKPDSLNHIPLPAIIHLKKEGGILHYAVLYRINKRSVKIMDPADGRMKWLKTEELCKEWTGYLILITPGDSFRKGRDGVPVTYRIRQIIIMNSGYFFYIILSSVVYIILSFSTSLFIKYIVDNILPGKDIASLKVVTAAMLIIASLSFLTSWFRSGLMLKMSIKIDKDLMIKYLSHIFKLPCNFFRNKGSGDITSRVHDACKIRTLVADIVITITISLSSIVLSLILMLTICRRLGMMTLIFIPVYIAVYLFYDRYNRIARRDILEECAKFENILVESIKSYRSVKYFGLEKYITEKICSRLVKMNLRIFVAGSRGIFLSGLGEYSSLLLTVNTLCAGSFFVLSGGLTAGELISFYTITSLFSAPLSSLVKLNSSLRDGSGAAARLFEILDLETEHYESGVIPDTEKETSIKLENVFFRYPGRDELLKNVCFEIRSGEITALCGESGCGKSTIASLILRSETITGGKILLDGTNIYDINLKIWRKLVSFVPQEPELFSGSITDNIAAGDNCPDLSAVTELCDKLGLFSFINLLPSGLESRTGEGGTTLSRGQQQKIAIARALYRKPKILVLDEATSSLDTMSGKIIERVLLEYKEAGLAILMISHNKEELAIADKLVTIKDRQILRIEQKYAGGAHPGLYPQAICGNI
jgi:ATP-binding cassette subfamily B protein